MTGQLMRHFGILLSKIKVNNEKQARTVSHLKYMSQCKEQSIIPRGLNLVRLVKSQIIWESSNDAFEILIETSNKLLDQEMSKWEKKKCILENQNRTFMKQLEENINHADFVREKENFERHKLSVTNVENQLKARKIQRDTAELKQLKQKYDATPQKTFRCR